MKVEPYKRVSFPEAWLAAVAGYIVAESGFGWMALLVVVAGLCLWDGALTWALNRWYRPWLMRSPKRENTEQTSEA